MKKCLFLLCSFLVISLAKGQYVTFVDSVKVREAPSLSAKVIGRLRHNTPIQPDYNGELSLKEDSIGGVKSYWYLIKYKGIRAYVWSPLQSICKGVL